MLPHQLGAVFALWNGVLVEHYHAGVKCAEGTCVATLAPMRRHAVKVANGISAQPATTTTVSLRDAFGDRRSTPIVREVEGETGLAHALMNSEYYMRGRAGAHAGSAPWDIAKMVKAKSTRPNLSIHSPHNSGRVQRVFPNPIPHGTR
jgi:hypothetical protein